MILFNFLVDLSCTIESTRSVNLGSEGKITENPPFSGKEERGHAMRQRAVGEGDGQQDMPMKVPDDRHGQ